MTKSKTTRSGKVKGKKSLENSEAKKKTSEKTGKERRLENLIPFSGKDDPRRNKNGRPKKVDTFGDILKTILSAKIMEVTLTTGGEQQVIKIESDKPFSYAVGVKLIIGCLKGDVQAIRHLMDRVDGKPAQSINLSAQENPFQEFTDMPADKKWEFLEEGMKTLERHRSRIVDVKFEGANNDEQTNK